MSSCNGGWAILASGFSRRFGTDKLLADLPGTGASVLEYTAKTYVRLGHPVAVVLRTDQILHRRVLPDGVRVLLNEDADEGMAAAIRQAVTWASRYRFDWLGVALADMPWVRPDTLRSLCRSSRPDRVVRPVVCSGSTIQPGHPVVFGQHFFSDLACLTGDTGGKRLLSRLPPDRLQPCPTDDPGCIEDVDVPEDLERCASFRVKRR